MIFDHYLTVQPWIPDFDTNQSSLQHLLVWVRIPCLLIEYYDHKFMMQLGAKLRKLIKIDEATSLVSRGHFAIIYVEVDLSKQICVEPVSFQTTTNRIRRDPSSLFQLWQVWA